MKQNHQQKHLFRSSYCLDCKQRKSCGKVSLEYCCSFYYQSEQEKAKEYSNYEKVSESKKREQKASFQQLQLLKSYQGCPKCGSKEIDSYELYENNRLVCQPCLMKKRDSSTNPISFSEQSK
jgi:formylmethanofuran dehydrogenase subunit E